MSDTVRMHVPKAGETPARRIEIFTGAGRRRNWSAEDKAAIVAESYSSGGTVCDVARRHGLTHSQLFAWRRAASRSGMKGEVPALPRFVPAVMEKASSLSEGEAPKRTRRSTRTLGIVEIEIDGVRVRVRRGADAKTIAAVIKALKASS